MWPAVATNSNRVGALGPGHLGPRGGLREQVGQTGPVFKGAAVGAIVVGGQDDELLALAGQKAIDVVHELGAALSSQTDGCAPFPLGRGPNRIGPAAANEEPGYRLLRRIADVVVREVEGVVVVGIVAEQNDHPRRPSLHRIQVGLVGVQDARQGLGGILAKEESRHVQKESKAGK